MRACTFIAASSRWPRRGIWLPSALAAATLLAPASHAQEAWAPQPIYQFAGRYEGILSSDELVAFAETPEADAAVIERRAGAMLGLIALDVACDGSMSGEAHAGTSTPGLVRAVLDGASGPRVARLAMAF